MACKLGVIVLRSGPEEKDAARSGPYRVCPLTVEENVRINVGNVRR